MAVVAIFGAGDLGGTLASTLAGRERIREVRLIDRAAGVAAGKALDILQAGPIESSTTRVVASGDPAAADDVDVVVLADAVGPPIKELQGEEALALLRRLRERNTRAPIVCAGPSAAWLIARATVELRLPAAQIVGSAPFALAGALRALVALELNGSAQDVSLSVAGLPPAQVIVPWQSASIAGTAIEQVLDPAALRRLDAKMRFLWPPGPYALASAAARFAEALIDGSRQTFCGWHCLPEVAKTATSGADGRVAPAPAPNARSGAGTASPAVSALAGPLRLDRGAVRALPLPELTAAQRIVLDAARGTR